MTAKEQGAKLVSAEGQMIRELAELLNDTGLTEIEIEKSGLKIRVAKKISVNVAPQAYPAVAAPMGSADGKQTDSRARRSLETSRRCKITDGRHGLSLARTRLCNVLRSRQQS